MKNASVLKRIRQSAIGLLGCTLLTLSCTDHDGPQVPAEPVSSPEVVTSWLNMQLKIAQAMPASPPVHARRWAYSGVALWESLQPGLPGYRSIASQLNGLPSLPQPSPSLTYYFPASANAALAAINRAIHPGISAIILARIDSLEAVNLAKYQQHQQPDVLANSVDFGKKIAAAIFEWSKTDGYDSATPYTPLGGAAYWKPTPPAFGPAILSNWGKVRTIVSNSDAGAEQGAPIAYSEDKTSEYYKQVEELYNISQSLTQEQRTIATYWPDNSWHNVLSQVLATEKPGLAVAAKAFTQLGIAMSDGAISLCKGKYVYQGVRPVTYIRTILNHPEWNTVIPTPPHPEYPSGHSVMSAAAAEVLTAIFGENYHYTDKPYNLPAFAPRQFNSFDEAAAEAAVSRVYAGIHYRKTCEVSLLHGKIVGQNVINALKFE
ncbi:vanadium-dependent haloperoxidase [Dyadobacter endophyticus]|uniref:vanadium-dependent haloperoxidase n=1 Tax=Dyadobacter TaxID=120831 RepID=UPI003CFA25D9